ncbi:MAG: hypothetical protein K0U86_01965 [Planctomycetes bacterium]|nr:hypothetical protein [Planctomycetota bacterium]MCH9723653.1 hypothetical protein [Planctomycetota bacterium]MCH9778471.1 hypothetical protein [Planctomycetota bacterium]MCH9791462.1 hypothetical protein [Planctomycetota bacterium]
MNSNESSEFDIERRLEQIGNSMRRNVSLRNGVLDQLQSDPGDNRDASEITRKSERKYFLRFGELTLLRKLLLGGLAASVLLLLTFGVFTSSATVSFAQVIENVRKATNYQADVRVVSIKDRDASPVSEGKMYWRIPGDSRLVEYVGSMNRKGAKELAWVQVHFRSKPGVAWTVKSKSYRVEPPHLGTTSPIIMLQNLVDFEDSASRQLGSKSINGIDCVGFEIELGEVDPNAGKGTIRVWVDKEKQLPLLVSMQLYHEVPFEMILENIVWNAELEETLFSTEPPAGYTLETPNNMSHEKQVASIISAFKLFAVLNDGKYPQVSMIYGDVTLSTLLELAGYAGRKPGAWMREEKYTKIKESGLGWGTLNQIMRTNAEASYNGLVVGPGDSDKVLFRWKLNDGSYQVIYGDLRTEKKVK